MRVTIGIDVGGTKIAAGLVTIEGQVLQQEEVATPSDPASLQAIPVEMAARLASSADVAAVGMGIAGLVRFEEGEFVWGPNVAGERIPFARLLSEELGLPAVVDNDANTAALAEDRYGAGRDHQHVLVVTLGTGIGGGIVTDGEIYRGWSFAGEVGHMVVDPEGPACTCGRRGCWEQLASGTALARLGRRAAAEDPGGEIARLAGSGEVAGEHVSEAARGGDGRARSLIEELAEWVGLGLANLVVVLDPEVVVVGGGLVEMGELLLEPTRRATRRGLPSPDKRPVTPIVEAVFREDSGVVGAGALAWGVVG